MIFHEQHSYGYGFPSQPLTTCASAGVSECFLSAGLRYILFEIFLPIGGTVVVKGRGTMGPPGKITLLMT